MMVMMMIENRMKNEGGNGKGEKAGNNLGSVWVILQDENK